LTFSEPAGETLTPAPGIGGARERRWSVSALLGYTGIPESDQTSGFFYA
jgi:hypothetical protein